ncbi:MAG: hypothetical protein ABIE94_00080 [archaeon]
MPAKKKVVKKKIVKKTVKKKPVKKKVVKKKAVKKKAVKKKVVKKPIKKKVVKTKLVKKKAVPKPVKKEQFGTEVGKITHYFGHISVAVIQVTGKLKVGDTIHIKGATTDFTQKVDSMQIEHDKIQEAKKGDDIGMKVKDHVREHDIVYLV